MSTLTLSDIAAAVALVFSAYSLWQSSLRPPALQIFVPPVITYASPLQNSNFEALMIPVTITNEGAQTGTILSVTLEATALANKATKRFYSANFGQWTNEKFRSGEFQPFAPISIPGRTSLSSVVQFYARTEEPVMQIVSGAGRYKFAITLDTPASSKLGLVSRLLGRRTRPLIFEMVLPTLDNRSFTIGAGTVVLHQEKWQSSTRA
jgi:hypothetical protein